jgi:hypothetical protein
MSITCGMRSGAGFRGAAFGALAVPAGLGVMTINPVHLAELSRRRDVCSRTKPRLGSRTRNCDAPSCWVSSAWVVVGCCDDMKPARRSEGTRGHRTEDGVGPALVINTCVHSTAPWFGKVLVPVQMPSRRVRVTKSKANSAKP